MNVLIETLVELFIIIICAKAAGEVFERIKQPAVVGELLIGMLIGPHALGLAHENEIIAVISELAVIFLLFHVGLETKLSDMLKVGKRSLWVAILGVVLPFAAGVGYWLARQGQVPAALFLGAAMVATSVGITARVLADLKFLQTVESRIILGAAVIDDVLGMIVLAMVSGLSQGAFSWWKLAGTTGLAVAFVVLVVLLGTVLTRRFGQHLAGFRSRNMPFILALSACFGLAALAQAIGLAAIIGAFLAGMVFAEVREPYALEKKLEPMTDLLVPVFFVVMGMHVDVRLFTSGSVLLMGLIVTLMAIVTKWLGCGLAVLKDGWRTGMIVGVGMVPRGEVGLIIAAIGSRLGIFSQDLYAIIVVMCMATTLVMPPLLKWTVEAKQREERSRAGGGPAGDQNENPATGSIESLPGGEPFSNAVPDANSQGDR